MGLEIKGKAALGNKTLCPRSPKAKGRLLAHSLSASCSVLGPCTQPRPPECEEVQAPSLPHPCSVSLVDLACISSPPPTMTALTAASKTVSLTSGGQDRTGPTVTAGGHPGHVPFVPVMATSPTCQGASRSIQEHGEGRSGP